ncbi:MAG: hypothetical protein Q9226_001856 [Calogaya cf. arnoldii]
MSNVATPHIDGPSKPKRDITLPAWVYRRSEFSGELMQEPMPGHSRWEVIVRNGDIAMGKPPKSQRNIIPLEPWNPSPLPNGGLYRPPPAPKAVVMKERARRVFYKGWYVTTGLRFIQFICSVSALVLSIYIIRSHERSFTETVSVIYAVVVSCLAIPYLMYVGWDEFWAEPIGRRSPMAKVRQLLCDVIFICVASSNVTLAFATIVTREEIGDTRHDHRQLGLAVLLLVVLLAWISTFVLSVLRIIHVMDRRQKLTQGGMAE